MISTLVIIYFFVFIGLSYCVNRFVSTVDGFCVANRDLGLVMLIGITVIGWFDADNILGAPSIFIEKGLSSTYADPLGSVGCLLLIGFFIGYHFYKRNCLTLGSLYRDVFGKNISKILTFVVILSYIGAMTGQFLAIGLLLKILTHGYLSIKVGGMIAAVFIILYLVVGGMWVMAVSNIIQMVILMVSLVIVFWEITTQVGGLPVLLTKAVHDPHFSLLPSTDPAHLLRYGTEFLTMALGALPQQDIFQNVCSARNVRTMRYAFLIGGLLFLVLCALPMLSAYGGLLLEQKTGVLVTNPDPQMFLPEIIMQHSGTLIQTIFFGAIFSALIGSSPNCLLAPAVSLCDFLPESVRQNERLYLLCIRLCIALIGIISLVLLFFSSQNIYDAITGAYKVTFVSATVPLLSALYWKKATRLGGWASVIIGTASWSLQNLLAPEAMVPPELTGFLLSIAAMVIGSLLETHLRQQQATDHIATCSDHTATPINIAVPVTAAHSGPIMSSTLSCNEPNTVSCFVLDNRDHSHYSS